jgi:hypothetical protein
MASRHKNEVREQRKKTAQWLKNPTADENKNGERGFSAACLAVP